MPNENILADNDQKQSMGSLACNLKAGRDAAAFTGICTHRVWHEESCQQEAAEVEGRGGPELGARWQVVEPHRCPQSTHLGRAGADAVG